MALGIWDGALSHWETDGSVLACEFDIRDDTIRLAARRGVWPDTIRWIFGIWDGALRCCCIKHVNLIFGVSDDANWELQDMKKVKLKSIEAPKTIPVQLLVVTTLFGPQGKISVFPGARLV